VRAAKSPASFVVRLAPLYPHDAPQADPLSLILHENIGYLIDDARRQALFEEFEARVGLSAADIARTSDAVLLDIARRGGMQPEKRVARLREIAAIVLNECGGDLAAHLRTVPVARARAFLKRFPGVGDPGADRILLFCGLDTRPALDSNGLRVLVRLGCVAGGSSYAAMYRSAVTRLAQRRPCEREWLVSAYLTLREHGRRLCRRTTPQCMECPLEKRCAHAPAKGL
jgi:endonuclease-3